MARTKAVLGEGARLSDFLSASLLARVVPPPVVHEVLDAHGCNSQRIGSLPAVAGVYYCMALSLRLGERIVRTMTTRPLGVQMPTVKRLVALGLVTCGTLGTSLWSQAQPVASGDVLTTPMGRTLYVFDNDVPGSARSVCNAPCSNIFPPYLLEEGASIAEPLGVVRRDDGTNQWSYKGRPLYLFYADEKRGDVNGDGMNRGIWHVAKP